MHGSKRDYTFFSAPQKSYSRIDLFLVCKDILQTISCVTIGDITWSDHAPVTLQLEFRPKLQKYSLWRLNTAILANQKLQKLIWNAHKAYVRGLLIKLGTREKRERSEHINSFLKQIRQLENSNKQSPNQADTKSLRKVREELGMYLQSGYDYHIR